MTAKEQLIHICASGVEDYEKVFDVYDEIISSLKHEFPNVSPTLIEEAVTSINMSLEFYGLLLSDKRAVSAIIQHLNRLIKITSDHYSPDSKLFELMIKKFFSSHTI